MENESPESNFSDDSVLDPDFVNDESSSSTSSSYKKLEVSASKENHWNDTYEEAYPQIPNKKADPQVPNEKADPQVPNEEA